MSIPKLQDKSAVYYTCQIFLTNLSCLIELYILFRFVSLPQFSLEMKFFTFMNLFSLDL